MRHAEHPDTADLTLAAVLAAVSDPIRLQLVQVLADGTEKAWGQLRAPIAKSTLSHHLKTLRTAGVTRTRQEGTRCFVRLRIDDLQLRFPGLLDRLLALAPPPTQVSVAPGEVELSPGWGVGRGSAPRGAPPDRSAARR